MSHSPANPDPEINQTTGEEPALTQRPSASRKTKLHQRDLVLSHHDAEGGCPIDIAACGEEDPGAGIEDLIDKAPE